VNVVDSGKATPQACRMSVRMRRFVARSCTIQWGTRHVAQELEIEEGGALRWSR
jgi:hypothetical protein